MKITIRGKPKGISKKNIKLACEHFADILLSKRLSEKICISIVFESEYNELGPGVYGNCCPRYTTTRPRHFDMFLSGRINRRQTLLTLAHEFVHLKQYAMGELFDYTYRHTLSRWKGELYDNQRAETIEYWFLPWEVEALGLENGLVVTFLKKLRELGYK